jgi:hypothetical protein
MQVETSAGPVLNKNIDGYPPRRCLRSIGRNTVALGGGRGVVACHPTTGSDWQRRLNRNHHSGKYQSVLLQFGSRTAEKRAGSLLAPESRNTSPTHASRPDSVAKPMKCCVGR